MEYMIWNSDVAFEHEGTTYRASYKTDAITGKSWVSEIVNDETGEPVQREAIYRDGSTMRQVSRVYESDEWAELMPLAKRAMNAAIEKTQGRSCA